MHSPISKFLHIVVLAMLIGISIAVYPVFCSDWLKQGTQEGEHLGASLSATGDVNGDGFNDLLISAPYYDGNGTDNGRVSLYLGSQNGLSSTASWSIVGSQADALFGMSVALVGDVNHDGYDDALVSAPYFDGATHSDAGIVYLYQGTAFGLATTASWSAQGSQSNELFGRSVSGAGDVNNDGYADVIIGAPGYSNGQSNEGKAYVYLGSSSGLGATVAWSSESNAINAQFGYCVSSAGDINGDSYSDIIIGAPHYTNGQDNEGKVFVYTGSSLGLSGAVAWSSESNQADAEYGSCVVGVGDLNKDSYDDIAIGSPRYSNGQTEEGKVFVFVGSQDGLPATATWSDESNQAYARLGVSIAGILDINGDGYRDMAVGAPDYDDNGNENAGRVFLYYGCSLVQSSCRVYLAGSSAGGEYGISLGAGNFNNDLRGDIAIGSSALSLSTLAGVGQTNIIVESWELVFLKSHSSRSSDPVLDTPSYSYITQNDGTAADLHLLLTTDSDVRIDLLDLRGSLIHRMVERSMKSGNHEIPFLTDRIQSGVYFVKIEAGSSTQVIPFFVAH